jgi:hypothetical protein
MKTGSLFWGILLVVGGLLILLDMLHLGLIEVLVVVGLIFAAEDVIPYSHLFEYWPLILIGIGAGLLWKAEAGNQTRQPTGKP